MTLQEIAEQIAVKCSIHFDSMEFKVQGGKADFVSGCPTHNAVCCGVEGHLHEVDAAWMEGKGLIVTGFDTDDPDGTHTV